MSPDDEAERLRNILLAQMNKKQLTSGSILSINNDNDSLSSETDPESGNEDFNSRNELVEAEGLVDIDRLFMKQRENELEYRRLRSVVSKAKEELAKLEQELARQMKESIETSERIKSNFDRCFESHVECLRNMNEERLRWKAKLARRTERSKKRIRSLKKQTALIAPQSFAEPKIIPLSPVRTPPPPITPVKEDNGKSPSSYRKRRYDKAEEDGHSRKSSSRKKPKRHSSKDRRLDKLAEKLNISQTVGSEGKKTEAELLKRMLERVTKKHRSSTHSRERRREQSIGESRTNTGKEGAGRLEDSVHQSVEQIQEQLYSTPLRSTSIYPSISCFVSTEPTIQPPVMSIPPVASSYYHLAYPSGISVNSNYPPYTYSQQSMMTPASLLPELAMVVDRDFRIADGPEIIKKMLEMWPKLCPPNVTPDELARKLLEANSVKYVAKMLSSAIPETVKQQCFSEELKQFLQSS